MLTIRHIQLAPDGSEAELWTVEIPAAVEAEGAEAIDAYVAAQTAAPVATLFDHIEVPTPDAGVEL